MNDALKSEMLAYRRKHFAVEVLPASWPVESGEVALSITHNGYQWSSVMLLPEEIEKVIAALQSHKPKP